MYRLVQSLDHSIWVKYVGNIMSNMTFKRYQEIPKRSQEIVFILYCVRYIRTLKLKHEKNYTYLRLAVIPPFF